MGNIDIAKIYEGYNVKVIQNVENSYNALTNKQKQKLQETYNKQVSQ
jgi:hypothetical protein